MTKENSHIITCSSGSREFIYYEGERPSYPNCDEDLLDLLKSLGIGWKLGDWLGL